MQTRIGTPSNTIVGMELAGKVPAAAVRKVIVQDEQGWCSGVEGAPQARDAREALGQPARLLGDLAQQVERVNVVVHHEHDRRAD